MVLALPAVKVRAADEFTKVPVLVNVLKGVVMSDADIDDIIKETNKILKEPVAQWLSNPTVGSDGCLGQIAQFSVSHTAFVNFHLY